MQHRWFESAITQKPATFFDSCHNFCFHWREKNRNKTQGASESNYSTTAPKKWLKTTWMPLFTKPQSRISKAKASLEVETNNYLANTCFWGCFLAFVCDCKSFLGILINALENMWRVSLWFSSVTEQMYAVPSRTTVDTVHTHITTHNKHIWKVYGRNFKG